MISSTKLGTILIILAAASYLTVCDFNQTLSWLGGVAPLVCGIMLGVAALCVIKWMYDLRNSGWL